MISLCRRAWPFLPFHTRIDAFRGLQLVYLAQCTWHLRSQKYKKWKKVTVSQTTRRTADQLKRWLFYSWNKPRCSTSTRLYRRHHSRCSTTPRRCWLPGPSRHTSSSKAGASSWTSSVESSVVCPPFCRHGVKPYSINHAVVCGVQIERSITWRHIFLLNICIDGTRGIIKIWITLFFL